MTLEKAAQAEATVPQRHSAMLGTLSDFTIWAMAVKPLLRRSLTSTSTNSGARKKETMARKPAMKLGKNAKIKEFGEVSNPSHAATQALTSCLGTAEASEAHE